MSSATKLMGTSCVTPLARVQSSHTRHLANRNRATTIEWKWTWHTSHPKWCP